MSYAREALRRRPAGSTKLERDRLDEQSFACLELAAVELQEALSVPKTLQVGAAKIVEGYVAVVLLLGSELDGAAKQPVQQAS